MTLAAASSTTGLIGKAPSPCLMEAWKAKTNMQRARQNFVDEITLAVADKAEGDIATRIADEATLYIDQLRREQR